MRKLAAEWGVQASNRTREDVVYNSWRHEPFLYFPGEETLETINESDCNYSSSEDEGEEDTGDSSTTRPSIQSRKETLPVGLGTT